MSVCLVKNILYVLCEAGYASKVDLDKENLIWYYYNVHFKMTKKSSSTTVGDYLYTFGGWLYDDYHYNLVNSINYYNFLNETIYSLEAVSSFISPTARTHSAMCLIKGKFYVFGGKNKDYYLKDMWVYDPPSTTWSLTTTTSISPSARSNFASSCEGDAFLVWGGEDATGLNNDVFIYNSLTNAWNSLTPVTVDMPSKRKGVCAILKLPYAYITGGIDSNGICNDFWRFNFGNSTYVRIATVPGSINAKCFFHDNILEVIGGNGLNEEPLGLRFEYSMLNGKVLSYNWGKRSGEILLKMPSGVLQIGGRGDDKRLLDSVMLNGSYVDTINDLLYLPSYVYYNHSIYYFSGSIFTTRFTLFQNLPRPKFAVMHLPPIEKFGSENYYCSEGFFAYKGICEKCPAGTYASGIGNKECLKCDKGFYNSFQGASSVRQCYPCPEGTYNNYAGGTMCKECPQGNNCPTGSRDPANSIEKTATTYSVQPNLYQGVNLDSELALIQYLGALITGITLILVLAIPKLSDLIKKFDLYSTQHSYDEGDYIKIEKKKIGGVFSIIFIGASFVLTTSVLVIFIWGNISESKSLIPLVILESEVKDFATNFEVEITLENYGDKCVKNNDKDTCNDLIDVNSENIERKQVLMKCYISPSRTCKVRYICSNCRVKSKATISLIFQEKLSYASGISVNVTSDSSIPESRSSVYSSISPQPGFIFIGPSPNAFYFTLTPSYFTSSVSKFPSQLIGYHVDSSVLPTTGSQNLIENLSVTAQISVTIILEQILVGLYTSRFAKQSTLLLISGIFGTVTGLMGIVGIIMGKFEGFFKDKSQEITRKDRVKEIAHKRNEVIEMLFENHTIPVKIGKEKSETLSIVSVEGNTR